MRSVVRVLGLESTFLEGSWQKLSFFFRVWWRHVGGGVAFDPRDGLRWLHDEIYLINASPTVV